MNTNTELAKDEIKTFNINLINFKVKRDEFNNLPINACLEEEHAKSKELSSAAVSLAYAVLSCEEHKININFNKEDSYNIKIKVNSFEEYIERIKAINRGNPARTSMYPSSQYPCIVVFRANPNLDEQDFVNIIYMDEFYDFQF